MPILLLSGIAALAFLMLRGRSAGGWSKANTGITLSPTAAAWMDKLRAKVPSSIPLVVTSGTRTSRSQAQAMLTMVNLGEAGLKQARIDYPDALVDDLLELPRTLDAWAPRVAEAYASGELSSSGHLAGMAIDLRRRDWTSAQLATVVNAIKALGGRPLVENAPPHVHVQLPSSARSSAASTSSTATPAPASTPDLGTSFDDDDDDDGNDDLDPFGTSENP